MSGRRRNGDRREICLPFPVATKIIPGNAAGSGIQGFSESELVGPRDGQSAQQVWIDLVSWHGIRCVGPTIDGLDRHLPHQGHYVAAANLGPLADRSWSVGW
jgi:hypothetical protein